MPKPKRDLRSMRQAAMAGDHSAAGALLRLYGFDEIAAEIKRKRNLRFSPRVRRAVDALTAGTGAPGTIGEWEFVEADGTITNDVQFPPSPRRARTRTAVFDD
jgi:hypothetical protein